MESSNRTSLTKLFIGTGLICLFTLGIYLIPIFLPDLDERARISMIIIGSSVCSMTLSMIMIFSIIIYRNNRGKCTPIYIEKCMKYCKKYIIMVLILYLIIAIVSVCVGFIMFAFNTDRAEKIIEEFLWWVACIIFMMFIWFTFSRYALPHIKICRYNVEEPIAT